MLFLELIFEYPIYFSLYSIIIAGCRVSLEFLPYFIIRCLCTIKYCPECIIVVVSLYFFIYLFAGNIMYHYLKNLLKLMLYNGYIEFFQYIYSNDSTNHKHQKIINYIHIETISINITVSILNNINGSI